MTVGRYYRQEIFYPIGRDGQERLAKGRVCIIGIGALGASAAGMLATAGVGYLRLIDRDIVELTNLQRQILFTEADAAEQVPKAEAARARLAQMNSEVDIEARIVDVNPFNVEKLIGDVDVVVDGLDNLETRYLLNEACHKLNMPYVYGGVVGSGGMVMNILPGEGPCLECLLGSLPEEGTYDTCDTVGVISPITNMVASYEAAETMKLLLGSESLLHQAISVDAWDSYTEFFDVDQDPDCPVCGKRQYSWLERRQRTYSASLCGHDAYQITPEDDGTFDYDGTVEWLRSQGEVEKKKFFTTFVSGDADLKLFPDGRAIINHVPDVESAQRIFARYIDVQSTRNR
ncbi:MAG: ThiF family adenylyltransferase [Bacillota bacterium]|nr:ThiF family adenylyltransferase [Bacillota bacterium]